jgi:two-component system phosphate regulon sensor histidine kinase PhoR
MGEAFCIFSGLVATVAVLGYLIDWRRARRRARALEQAMTSLAAGDNGLETVIVSDELPPTIERLIREVAEERARLQRAAGDTEYNLKAILASMAEGVMVVDNNQIIRLVNPSLLKLFALKSDPVGQTALGALRLPLLKTMLDGALQDGTPQQGEFPVYGLAARPPIHLIVSAVPVRDAAGVPGAVTVFRDVSRLRQLEEMRREFVANVSHELRTPLSIFHGYLENLLDNPGIPEEDLASVLRVMRKHSLRLNALVEDLLTLARLESRRDALEKEPVDLEAFLREILADWKSKTESKEIQLSIDVPPGLPALPVDRLRLHQVMDNLLDNALKYTSHGGRITLHAASLPGQIEIRVEDTGAGIPPADVPHIFERFYRADKARSRELGGTGLGLSIVKHILQVHGGSVAAESVFGKGTTIILVFPVEPDEAAQSGK